MKALSVSSSGKPGVCSCLLTGIVIGREYRGNEQGRGLSVTEEVAMKSGFVKPFLIGFACGMGITLLCLCTQGPGSVLSSIDRIGEKGRMRRTRKGEERVDRALLKAAGFSDSEIEEAF